MDSGIQIWVLPLVHRSIPSDPLPHGSHVPDTHGDSLAPVCEHFLSHRWPPQPRGCQLHSTAPGVSMPCPVLWLFQTKPPLMLYDLACCWALTSHTDSGTPQQLTHPVTCERTKAGEEKGIVLLGTVLFLAPIPHRMQQAGFSSSPPCVLAQCWLQRHK